MKDLRKVFKLNKKEHNNNFTFLEVVFITLAFGIIVCGLTGFIVYNITKKTVFDSNLKDVISSYKEIVDTYYEDVDKEKLADSAIKGMMNYLDESYSTLLDTEGTEELNDSLTDDYKGVGMEVYTDGTNYIIYDVIENSSAESAGLEKGDIIKSINGNKIDGSMATDEITDLISESDKVKVVVTRDDKDYTYNLVVRTVTKSVVSSNIYEENNKKIGYIYLDTFSKKSGEQFRNELEILEHEGIDSLIIDVRDNTGGYLSGAETIANLFLKKGKTIYTLKGKEMNNNCIDSTDESRDYPVVVLINEYTASASEVLALALKESYGATLVGTQSYGKGKVQITSTLSNDETLKYTTALWYSPNGNNIDGKGITPGIKVDQSLEFILKTKNAKDTQLEKAKEFLSEQQ